MKKRKIVSTIFGIAVVFVMLGVELWASSSIVDSTGELDIVDTVEVTAQEQCNCDCGATGSIGFPNPAAAYCTEMGYEYKTVKTEAGERGICVLPNGDEVDEWAFYRGECAPEFSYCAKMGWPVAAEAQSDSYSDKCCTCILPDGSHKTVSELLDLGPDYTVAIDTPMDTASTGAPLTESQGELPESFDWRNKDGQDWLTPVKNQGKCGSCWAFSAVGAVESQYNIFNEDATLDLDLSEQYLVSDCSDCGDCDGGSSGCALEFIQDYGITDEACFPYTATDCPCSDRCPDWNTRLYTIDATGYLPDDIETIKEYLINKGPLSACLRTDWYYDYGILRCTEDVGTDHCIVIVGYDEAEDYWIIKNSWGTSWHEDGYAKVGFGECSIESNVRYVVLYRGEEVIYRSHEIDDSAGGNGDGYLQPGESITMPVTLRNISNNTTFIDVTATLAATTTTLVPTTTIFSEDFEGSWPGNWAVGDWDPSSGEDYWGQSDYRAYSGNFSAYCANVSDVSGQYYDNDMSSFMVRDVDLSAYESAILSYKYWLDCENYFDRLYTGYFDSYWHWTRSYTGNSTGWASGSMGVPPTATQVGFWFDSDDSITGEGAYIDDVVLTGYSYAPDPYISISDDSEEYGDIPPSGVATSPGAYEFTIDPACPPGHIVTFTLNITASNGGPWSDSFLKMVRVLHDLTISTTGRGLVIKPGKGVFTYDEGTVVDLEVEALGGYDFVEWTGDVDTIADVTAVSTNITMNDNYSITAKFTGGCFIATAAYGTPMAEEIQILREFRDKYLLTNPVGKDLVEFYYKVSPPIAEFITEHPSLKPIVRAGLVPAVAMSTIAVNTTPAEKMVIVGLLVLVSVALAVWATRRRGRGPQYTLG